MRNQYLTTTIVCVCVFFTMHIAAQETGTFTDIRDGKTYKTVTIGTQTWMAENLAYKASSGSWAYNKSASYVATYGYLYNWTTAKTVCPAGWHLPSDVEWTTLTTFLGGESVAGGKLKEIDTTHWISPNAGATNETGFTALPGGARNDNGTFYTIGNGGYWWSTKEMYATNAWYRLMDSSYSVVGRYYGSKELGFSVRCVRD